MLAKNRKIFLVWLFIFSTGNPLVTHFFGNIFAAFFFLISFLIAGAKLPHVPRKLGLYILLIIVIFIVHGLTLQYLSQLAYLNLISKILFGWYVYTIIGKDFRQLLLKVVTQISKISLVSFFVFNLLRLDDFLPIVGSFKTVVFYNIMSSHELKNSGILWEPGAFAGLLVFTILLSISDFTKNIRNVKSEYFILMITILTTQSTGGYLCLLIIILFATFKKFGSKEVVLSFLILSLSLFVFNRLEFLGEKISDQNNSAEEQEIGEFSNTRLGSWYFDSHYILKRPLFGNGFDELERYSDHKFLIASSKEALHGNGNSLSNTWAKVGVIFIFFYLITVYHRFRKFTSLRNSSLVILLLFLMFQHEDWFNFPLFLSLNFINLDQNATTA